MTQTSAAQPVFETTETALQEKRKLRRHFRRFDMFFYLICTVVTIDTIGAVASNGAQGFTWLMFLGIFFFLPYALSIAELGSAFPQEGGPYVWTRLAFGRPLAAVNSVIYWISNPIWVGGSLTIVSFAAIEEFFGTVGGAWKYVYAVAFIWFTIGAAIVSLQYGKWVPTLGAWARGAVLTFFVILGHLVRGQARGARLRRSCLLAYLRDFHRRGAGADLQLRRPGSAFGRGRGDDQSPA